MTDLANSVLEMFGLQGNPWILPLGFLALVALFWPMIHKNIDTDAGRKRLRGMSEMPLPERKKAQAEALEIVGDDPDGLLAVADEAARAGEKEFARVVLEKLKATGKKKDHVRRLESLLTDRSLQLPEQSVVAVERMIEAGLLEGARDRLAPALERWPDHPELLALKAKLDAPPAPRVASASAADDDEDAG